ncbi:hypothetical protein FQA47_012420 [Oryzias melastigma]|uniref:Uncharacterized protein n=1 Tax=Oryzias melastigma TaxID=30732 RepID=A0A834FQY7_ORYME|nr:hypothetical protein FQA47_012420 [Oryzias melastigma]
MPTLLHPIPGSPPVLSSVAGPDSRRRALKPQRQRAAGMHGRPATHTPPRSRSEEEEDPLVPSVTSRSPFLQQRAGPQRRTRPEQGGETGRKEERRDDGQRTQVRLGNK